MLAWYGIARKLICRKRTLADGESQSLNSLMCELEVFAYQLESSNVEGDHGAKPWTMGNAAICKCCQPIKVFVFGHIFLFAQAR